MRLFKIEKSHLEKVSLNNHHLMRLLKSLIKEKSLLNETFQKVSLMKNLIKQSPLNETFQKVSFRSSHEIWQERRCGISTLHKANWFPCFHFHAVLGTPWDILDPQIHSKLTNGEIIFLLCSFLVHVNHSLKFQTRVRIVNYLSKFQPFDIRFCKMTLFVTITHDALGPIPTSLDVYRPLFWFRRWGFCSGSEGTDPLGGRPPRRNMGPGTEIPIERTWDQAARQEVRSYRDPLPCKQNDRIIIHLRTYPLPVLAHSDGHRKQALGILPEC